MREIVVSLRHWYLSLCMGGVWSAGWIENPTSRPDATRTGWQIPVSHGYINFLLMMGTRKQKREINKYIKQNCAPSWTYLLDAGSYSLLPTATTQTQALKSISGPSQIAKTRLLFFKRTQSRVITGLLTEHNSVRKRLIRRRCGTREETPARVLWVCEALATLTHTYLCSFFLDLEDVRSLWNFTEGKGLPWLWHRFKRHKGLVKKA